MSPIWTGPVEQESTLGLAYRDVLLSGEQGTAQTIKLMRKLVDDALLDPAFVRTAVDIVRPVPAYDDLGEVEALYNFVRSRIRFTKDPTTKEKLYPPQELLKIRAGDCDDISMLLAALLMAVGYNARFVTVSANPESPEDFSHVYVEAEFPGGSKNWMPLDAARPGSEFGIAPPVYFRKRAWSLTDDSYSDLSGARAFVHANVARRRPALGSYGFVNGLGDDFDWGSLVKQVVSEVPTIISAVAGKPSTASGPYGSFSTSMTPGYGIAPAGYQTQYYAQPSMVSELFSSPIVWLGAALLLLGGRNR